jgi:RNA 3'-phosphate cyclase
MATSYSAIMGEPISVYNIRANRSPPGLKPQHYTTLEALAEMCNAEVEGLKKGSMEVKFTPREITGGRYEIDIGTAGSISLMLQCLAPVAAFADDVVELEINGGTAVKWSPPIPFVKNVVWRAFRRMGFKATLKTLKEGFYPKGGGLVEAVIEPVNSLKPIEILNQREIKLIKGISLCGKLPKHVAERQASSASSELIDSGIETDIDARLEKGEREPLSPGSMITLWAVGEPEIFMGADALGERGKPAERVGREAATNLLKQLRTGMGVDYHTADHMILPCSLATGQSSFTTSSISLHTLTAIELAKIITGAQFQVNGKKGEPGAIRCQGVSHVKG